MVSCRFLCPVMLRCVPRELHSKSWTTLHFVFPSFPLTRLSSLSSDFGIDTIGKPPTHMTRAPHRIQYPCPESHYDKAFLRYFPTPRSVPFMAACSTPKFSVQFPPIPRRVSLTSFVSTSFLSPSRPAKRCCISLTFPNSIPSSPLGARGVQRGLPASRYVDIKWLGEPGSGQRRTSMRVSLTIWPDFVSHIGPRRLVKFLGLSSLVTMRRRMGYPTTSAAV